MTSRPLAALLVALALAALPSRAGAQGFINVAVGGGVDTQLSGTVDARVGLFKTFGLQSGAGLGILTGHPASQDALHPGHYLLATGSLGFHPYVGFGEHVGLAGHVALGVGQLLSPPSTADGTRDKRTAITVEAGPELHLFPTSVFGFAISADWRLLYVNSPFDGFPSTTTGDFVFRLWLELSFLR
jgi:hypothetical protein